MQYSIKIFKNQIFWEFFFVIGGALFRDEAICFFFFS